MIVYNGKVRDNRYCVKLVNLLWYGLRGGRKGVFKTKCEGSLVIVPKYWFHITWSRCIFYIGIWLLASSCGPWWKSYYQDLARGEAILLEVEETKRSWKHDLTIQSVMPDAAKRIDLKAKDRGRIFILKNGPTTLGVDFSSKEFFEEKSEKFFKVCTVSYYVVKRGIGRAFVSIEVEEGMNYHLLWDRKRAPGPPKLLAILHPLDKDPYDKNNIFYTGRNTCKVVVSAEPVVATYSICVFKGPQPYNAEKFKEIKFKLQRSLIRETVPPNCDSIRVEESVHIY